MKTETATMNLCLRLCAALVLLGMSIPPASAQSFPFDQEMLLEIKAVAGFAAGADDRSPSRRQGQRRPVVPQRGRRVRRSPATRSSSTFVSAKPENCTPERIELDQKMAKDLLEVTQWRRKNDIVEFVGPTTFRFRISTH